MKFLHISDTHFLQEYGNSLDYFNIQYNPFEILERFLKNYQFQGHDFVVHTGDLIHDGNASDYAAFKAILEKYVPHDIPIYYCLGNHDIKADFYEGFGIEPTLSQSYFYEVEHDGYRLLFLDSASEEIHDGIISNEQIDWLYERLSQPSEKGSFIFQHHPYEISWVNGMEKTVVPEDYLARLEQTDLLGIFTGHLHMRRVCMFGRIPQFTGNAFIFGISREGDDLWNTNRCGYSVVEVNGTTIDVFDEIINPEPTKLNQNII